MSGTQRKLWGLRAEEITQTREERDEHIWCVQKIMEREK